MGSVTLDLGTNIADEVVALDSSTGIIQMVFGWYGPELCGTPDDVPDRLGAELTCRPVDLTADVWAQHSD